MKIIFLIRALTYGGAERQLTLLSKGLSERGHDVVIATFYSGGPLEQELESSNVRLLTLNKRGRWEIFRFVFRLILMVWKERPDIVHGYLWDPNLLALVLKLFTSNLKIVWGIRSSARDVSQEHWADRLCITLNRRLSRFPDAIIVNSQVGRDHCLALGYPADKTVVVPNGVDTERFNIDSGTRRRIREEWGISENEHLVGVVGRLSPVKDHPNFLKAAALLSKDRSDVRFVCVGDGPEEYRHELHALAEDLGLQKSLNWMNAREDTSAVYNALDILVSSSYTEGLSNVISEAMACGVRCVVTNTGDSAWVVGKMGEVVPPKEPVALKDAISRLLEQKSYRRTQIRQSIVARLSVGNLVTNTERALNALLNDTMSRARPVKALRRPRVNS